MNKLKNYKLSTLYSMSSGVSTSPDQAGHGYPFLSFSTIFNNPIIPDELDERMDTTFEDRKKCSVKRGDVFLTRTSETLDELAMSSVALRDYPNSTFSGFAKRLRPNSDTFPDPAFMAAYLRGPYFRKVIQSMTTMTTRASFNKDLFGLLELQLVDYQSQVGIGKLFSNIESQINLNRKVNDNLHQMVQEIYLHMFFGCKPNAKLGDLLIEHPKSTVQVNDAKGFEGIVPFFTSGESILRWNEPMTTDSICLLNTGGNADVKFYAGAAAYSTDTWCISATDDLTEYLYMLLQTIRKELDIKFFTGTGLKHLQKPLLKERPVYQPTSKEAARFNRIAIPAMALISENIRQNCELQALRDWLLPMLMNGQATVEATQPNYRLSYRSNAHQRNVSFLKTGIRRQTGNGQKRRLRKPQTKVVFAFVNKAACDDSFSHRSRISFLNCGNVRR